MDKFKSLNDLKKKMGEKVDAAKKELKDKYEIHQQEKAAKQDTVGE